MITVFFSGLPPNCYLLSPVLQCSFKKLKYSTMLTDQLFMYLFSLLKAVEMFFICRGSAKKLFRVIKATTIENFLQYSNENFPNTKKDKKQQSMKNLTCFPSFLVTIPSELLDPAHYDLNSLPTTPPPSPHPFLALSLNQKKKSSL